MVSVPRRRVKNESRHLDGIGQFEVGESVGCNFKLDRDYFHSHCQPPSIRWSGREATDGSCKTGENRACTNGLWNVTNSRWPITRSVLPSRGNLIDGLASVVPNTANRTDANWKVHDVGGRRTSRMRCGFKTHKLTRSESEGVVISSVKSPTQRVRFETASRLISRAAL